jgi:hypothetical protein
MTPVLIPCSRSAHDQNVLARRAQGDHTGAIPRERERASLEGAVISLDARSGRPSRSPRYRKCWVVTEKNAKMQSLNSRSEGQSGCSLLRARKRIPKKTLSETRKEGGSSCSVYSREDHSAPSGLTFRAPLAIFTKSKLVLPADPRCPASDSNSSSADRSSCRAVPR